MLASCSTLHTEATSFIMHPRHLGYVSILHEDTTAHTVFEVCHMVGNGCKSTPLRTWTLKDGFWGHYLII